MSHQLVTPVSFLPRHPPRPCRGPTGGFAKVARAIGDAGGSLARSTSSASSRTRKCATSQSTRRAPTTLSRSSPRSRSWQSRNRTCLRPDIPTPPRRQDRDGVEVATPRRATTSQWPTRRRRPRLHGDRRRREQGLNLTIKQNTVAVVSDGTAVLGLGNIGPEAAMPVMEGKAMLFKEFGQVDAWPICLATTDPTRSSPPSPRSHPASEASISKTSRATMLRDRARLRETSTFPSSTTISTGPRSS